MIVQNLSVSIPNVGCNKNCPYCISKITGSISTDAVKIQRNLPKVKAFAKSCNVSSVSITSKGEPLLNMDFVIMMLNEFKEFPLELQTNGLELIHHPEYIQKLYNHGLDVIAFSIDDLNTIDILKNVFTDCIDIGWTVRWTVNVTDLLPTNWLDKIISQAENLKINQLSFRNITYPYSSPSSKYTKWIDDHAQLKDGTGKTMYFRGIDDLYTKYLKDLKPFRILPYGSKLYDYHGIAITYFDFCMQDTSSDCDLRSLIFLEDGHLYTSWANTSSRII